MPERIREEGADRLRPTWDGRSLTMFDTREKPRMVESAFLVGRYVNLADEDGDASLLAELAELVGTLG